MLNRYLVLELAKNILRGRVCSILGDDHRVSLRELAFQRTQLSAKEPRFSIVRNKNIDGRSGCVIHIYIMRERSDSQSCFSE